MAPLIGQYSVSVTRLTNQLFVWVYLNSGPDLTKRVPSFEREREDLSIDVKHDSVRCNEKKLRTIKNVVSYAVLHHISISWLDLKNAFGSVRHSLIIFALQYYGFPDHFIQLVRSYYDHLSEIVAVPSILSTNAIHFALDVFQGCTLSPTLFNIIVQLALDSVEQKQCGYEFSSDPETVLQSSVYADDVQFVTSLVEQNQCLLNIFDSFLLWSQTMSARPNKCWSVALRKHASGSYHRFDPRLTISNEALQYLDDGDFRYLGRPTNVKRSESRCCAEVEAQLSQWLDTINDLDLPATSKLWLINILL